MASQALVQKMKGAETAAVELGHPGQGLDLQAVVQSVMSAQESLQTALAIRDKAVAAFQESHPHGRCEQPSTGLSIEQCSRPTPAASPLATKIKKYETAQDATYSIA